MSDDLEIEVKELQLQNLKMIRKLDAIEKHLESLSKQDESSCITKEYLTLEETWQLKGGCSLNTLKSQPFLRVGCGSPKFVRYIGGRLCYARSDVLVWANICDGPEYIEYAKNTCGITVIPEKYLRLAEKAARVTEVV